MFHIPLLVFFTSVTLATKVPLDQGSSLINFRLSHNHIHPSSDYKPQYNLSLRTNDRTNTKKHHHLLRNGLPGQPSSGVHFKQYAGEISVDRTAGRALFYYFVESSNNSSTNPLILWLNGGPGCSSIGMGALTEIGPFGVNPDGQTLYAREFAWNKVANVLFLESPAGVGFSYSNTTSDYNSTGDHRTAEDTYVFLMKWLEMYPTFKGRDFYLTGESYAGYYIPELADIILENVKYMKDSKPIINIKGIMIGNGMIDEESDIRGAIDYAWTHALASDETHKELTQSNASSQWQDLPSSMFPIYKKLMGHGLRIFLYSGDVDACVPVTSTRYALAAMGLKVIEPWHSWTISDNSLDAAGFKVVYDGLTYATIMGAGHQVPLSYPDRLFHLLNDFLGNL